MTATGQRRILRAATFAALVCAAALLAVSPQKYTGACAEGIALWAKAVLPALFPFLVFSALLSRAGAAPSRKLAPLMRKARLPAAAALCFFLSAISGYPVGSRAVADCARRGEIPRGALLRTALLCSTSGPMFLLGTVGGTLYGSARAGAILLSAHLLSALLLCLLTLPFSKRLPEERPQPLRGDENGKSLSFADGVCGAVTSVLCVGGFVALFYVIGQMLADIGALQPAQAIFTLLFRGAENAHALAAGLTRGLLEGTQGCAALAAAGSPLSLPLTAFVVTFGGASILAQQLAFLCPAGVKALPFIGLKAVQGILAFSLAAAIVYIK